MVEIIKTFWGIASREGNKIYLNKHLNKYPELKARLLCHEKLHTDGLTKKDIAMDVFNDELKYVKKDYWRFVLTHPKSWVEFTPLRIRNKKLILNPAMIMIWSFTIGLFWFIGVLI